MTTLTQEQNLEIYMRKVKEYYPNATATRDEQDKWRVTKTKRSTSHILADDLTEHGAWANAYLVVLKDFEGD